MTNGLVMEDYVDVAPATLKELEAVRAADQTELDVYFKPVVEEDFHSVDDVTAADLEEGRTITDLF